MRVCKKIYLKTGVDKLNLRVLKKEIPRSSIREPATVSKPHKPGWRPSGL
jgi:hypothetical protein